MITLLLAGGQGTRIRPLSARRPKPMLPVVNRPILERTLGWLAASELRDVVIVSHGQAEQIGRSLAPAACRGLELRHWEADADHGTAGAAARAAADHPSDTYLVVSGDLVCDFDLRAIVAAHRAAGAAATVALTRVENPLQFGVVVTDGSGRIRRFLEKPTWGEVFSDTVNAGIFVLEPEVLAAIAPARAMDFAADLLPGLLEQGALLHGHLGSGYWRDVGDVESYLEAHLDYFDGRLRIAPPGAVREYSGRRAWTEGEVEVAEGVELRGRVVLGPGCRVAGGARLEDVVLGPGTEVAAGAELRGTVTWEDVRIGRGARCSAAVLGAGVVVGDGSIVEEGAVVADGSRLGREVRVKESVKLWPDKIVEDHAVVHSNLVYAERWRTSAFEEGAVTGLTNLELTPEVAARLGAAYATLLPVDATVLSVRDAHPASRMLRRAFVGGVGSAGVHIIDLGLLPVPVMRQRLEHAAEVGAVAFHQVPLVDGMTSIRFFDAGALDISSSFAKSVERVFMREEFRRVAHDEVGAILEQIPVADAYSEAYLHALAHEEINRRRFRLVVDYAHSAASVILPELLAELGCDVVTLNAHAHDGRTPMLPADVALAHSRLAAIVRALDADLGVWLHPLGERLAVIDADGRVWQGMGLTALVIAALIAADLPPGEVVLPTYAPSGFRPALEARGHRVLESLSSPRALTEGSRRPGVRLATACDGDFIFPALHHAPDALFALGSLLELLARSGRPLAELGRLAPAVPVLSGSVPCPIGRKGQVMRRYGEILADAAVSWVDGIKVAVDGGWVLLRPDRVAARLHVHVEVEPAARANRLLEEHLARVSALVRGD